MAGRQGRAATMAPARAAPAPSSHAFQDRWLRRGGAGWPSAGSGAGICGAGGASMPSRASAAFTFSGVNGGSRKRMPQAS